MGEIDFNRIWEEAKENIAALDSCERPHEFEPTTDEKKWVHRYQCKKCNGVVTSECRAWYEKGLKDGRAGSS